MQDLNIINGSPKLVNLGTNDKSMKGMPPKPITIGQHVPLIFLMAAGGPNTKEVVDPARALKLYRSETFDRKKPYFRHTTRLLELMAAAGSTMSVVRIVPEDNDTIANVTIYLDVLKDDVDVYKRHTDGSIAYDNNGNPIVDKTVKGYKIKVIAEYNNDDESDLMGTKSAKTGYQEDSNGNKSTMYPIIELRAKYKGAVYNNYGVAFELPIKDEMPEEYVRQNNAILWKLYQYHRPDPKSTGVEIQNLYGSKSKTFVLKKDATDPITNGRFELSDAMQTWYNLTNPLMEMVYPNFEEPYVYYDNLEYIQKAILEVEKEYINADVDTVEGVTVNTSEWLDYLTDVDVEDQWGIVNPFTCVSSKRVPAFTYLLNDADADLDADHEEVYFSRNTPIYLGKGKDGTLSDEEFEKGVKKWLDKYLDANSEVMDVALNLENVLYDSGFSLDVKKEFVNFIALRKDTIVGLSTRESNLKDVEWKDLETQRSMGLLLKSRLALAPESTFFGTPVVRGFIVVGSGIDELDPSRHRYPLLMDIAYKAARMMGGQKWKRELLFDTGERNVILNYSKIEPEFVPQGIQPVLWNIGLIWPQPYRNKLYTFPQLQSVYDNDTSVLNNIFAAFAITVINKVADAAWRKFSGAVSYSPAELTAAVKDFMYNELKDKFAGLIKIEIDAKITDYDAITGYSWTVVTKMGGEVMKTVMVHSIEAYRKEDLK